jgi:HEAT repeat protein
MNLPDIQSCLNSQDPQLRMRGITALRQYEDEVAVPYLLQKVTDKEFIIRSFVAMGLGRKRTEAGFAALLDILTSDRDSNVRAEAASSLAMYGDAAVPHLLTAFRQNPEWIIRLSILAVLAEMNHPQVLFQICEIGLTDPEPVVQETAIAQFRWFVGTPHQQEALDLLLSLTQSSHWQKRCLVVLSLSYFPEPEAQAAINELRQDPDYRVVAATLEALLPKSH